MTRTPAARASTTRLPAKRTLAPSFVHRLPAGWASNTVNTAIYRGAGLVSAGGWQFGSYYETESSLLLFRRSLADGEVALHRLPVRVKLWDAHHTASLGVDPEGYLHLSYHQHGTALNYRRSRAPFSIEDWEPPTGMTGAWEDRVTYPYFVTPVRAGQPLLFFYRRGSATRGDLLAKLYDSATRRWRDIPAPILSGAGQQPWSAGPYINHPAVDARDALHLFFTWRTGLIGPEGFVNNHNLDYARTPDWGATWEGSNGRPLHLPITPANAETALGTPPGCNLINQCGAATDSRGRPFAVFYMDAPGGTLPAGSAPGGGPRYCLLWHDGEDWRKRWLPVPAPRFDLRGQGTLRLPMSRPDLVIDGEDTVWVLFIAQSGKGRLAALPLRGPNYAGQRRETRTLWARDLRFCEPVVDRLRWRQAGLLSLLLQATDQGDHEELGELTNSEPCIAEWRLA